ncbi:hypothetical protein HY991_01045 [Candidatus Micrarchaeota archaeon]|nr:hypothetical protein [Candidatus Micrarchaeota archaeon]
MKTKFSTKALETHWKRAELHQEFIASVRKEFRRSRPNFAKIFNEVLERHGSELTPRQRKAVNEEGLNIIHAAVALHSLKMDLKKNPSLARELFYQLYRKPLPVESVLRITPFHAHYIITDPGHLQFMNKGFAGLAARRRELGSFWVYSQASYGGEYRGRSLDYWGLLTASSVKGAPKGVFSHEERHHIMFLTDAHLESQPDPLTAEIIKAYRAAVEERRAGEDFIQLYARAMRSKVPRFKGYLDRSKSMESTHPQAFAPEDGGRMAFWTGDGLEAIAKQTARKPIHYSWGELAAHWGLSSPKDTAFMMVYGYKVPWKDVPKITALAEALGEKSERGLRTARKINKSLMLGLKLPRKPEGINAEFIEKAEAAMKDRADRRVEELAAFISKLRALQEEMVLSNEGMVSLLRTNNIELPKAVLEHELKRRKSRKGYN